MLTGAAGVAGTNLPDVLFGTVGFPPGAGFVDRSRERVPDVLTGTVLEDLPVGIRSTVSWQAPWAIPRGHWRQSGDSWRTPR